MRITVDMLDLCEAWVKSPEVERMNMANIIHDAFVEGGFPRSAYYHFLYNDSGVLNGFIRWNTCMNDDTRSCLFQGSLSQGSSIKGKGCSLVTACRNHDLETLINEEKYR